MYGFIYNTLRTLVVEKFGEETWAEICHEAECPLMVDHMVDRQYYDETYLAKVGATAEKKLGVPLEKILELFGAFFFETCKKSGHSSMLRTLGHNLYGFLMNLDSLHDHLSFTYTEMQAPSFLCEKTPSGLTLHYYSQRSGLSNIVLGIVKAVAKDFYSLDIAMEMVHYEKMSQKLAHHYTFNIEVMESCRDENYHERLTGERYSLPLAIMAALEEPKASPQSFSDLPSPTSPQCPMIGVDPGTPRPSVSPDLDDLHDQLIKAGLSDNEKLPTPVLPRISFSRLASRRGSAFPSEQDSWPISQTLFQTCFPFHILFDRDLTIRFMGVSLSRLFPKAISNGEKLSEHFELHRPALSMTYENIRSSVHNIFIMRIKHNLQNGQTADESNALHFRGQMILTSSSDSALILFLGSPRVSSIEELEHQGLYLSDIPVHDVTRDLILLNRHFRVEMGIARELEETKKDLQKQKAIAEEEKHRADDLLHAMLPRSVANELKKQREVSAMDFPEVTILFSDIKGFTNICNKCSPIQVVEMLNRLYTHFDGQLERHKVYKVETIGDAYMVAAGLLDTSKDHAAAITNMAFAMRHEAEKVMDPVNNESLKIRIGVHSGGVVAGVVGLKMPRYCLFGDTVNTASRMESHGEPGQIHISDTTYELLKSRTDQFVFYNRGLIEMKGLGHKQTYFVERKCDDGAVCEIIHVKPDSNKETSNTTSDHNTLQPSTAGSTPHNKSFIKLSQCTIVPPHDPQTDPAFENPPTPTVCNGSGGLVMSRPTQGSPIHKECEQETKKTPTHKEEPRNNLNPVPENYTMTEHQNESNGVTSLFISEPSNTSVIEKEPGHQTTPKQKGKCVIS